MEQHPIPRNVSSFEFHLIGDMTIRQFGYLAGGVLLAYLIFKIAPFPGLIKYPLMGLSAFTGFALAFLPIQERPLDRWLVAFLKSINSPTQYLWQKDNTPPEILLKPIIATVKTLPQNHQVAHRDANNKLEVYLSTLPSLPHQSINLREKKYVDSTLLLFNSVVIPQAIRLTNIPVNPPIVPQIQPVIPPVQEIPEVKPVLPIKPKISETIPIPTKFPESKITSPTVAAAPITQLTPKTIEDKPKIISEVKKTEETKIEEKKVMPTISFQIPSQPKQDTKEEAEKKLEEIRREKELLEKELQKLREDIEKSKKPQIVKPQVKEEEKKPTIKTVTPKTAVNEIGIPKLPQTPNIIMGVVKDTQRKLLPNIIITVKDLQGMPHRALKTNRLGQFSTATPLSNGTYHLEAEDPLNRYIFDIAEIVLTGKVFLPIEITAKGEKEIMREKLTKELFGNPSVI